VTRLSSFVRLGQLKYREEIVDGLENASGSIADLYAGNNMGKRLIRLIGA
jgi:NADPH-dependent curcumin reductase CurA